MSIPDWAFDDDDFDEEDDDDWTDLMCSMGPDGQCGQAGSEYCEFECPHRDADPLSIPHPSPDPSNGLPPNPNEGQPK